MPQRLAGDEVVQVVAGVDGVVGEALVEAAEQGAVDGRLHAVLPGTAEHHHEQALVQVVHLVVVALERRGALGVGVGQGPGDLAGDGVGDVGHLPDDRGQVGRYGRNRVTAAGGAGHVLGQVAHPLDVGGDVQGADHVPQ